MFDACANGQTLKCLTVVDEWTRESLAIDVAGGIRSGRVIEVLTQLVSLHGAPRYLRSDNGPEFVAGAILRWLLQAQIETALIEPGKPWQNATDESFNGKFRDEYLSLQWFRNRVDAKVGIEQWRRHYNDVQPHSSLGYLTPAEFKAQLRAGSDEGTHSRHYWVSIHAPLWARPPKSGTNTRCWIGFNPRAPAGATPAHPMDIALSVLFQSTRPCGRDPKN